MADDDLAPTVLGVSILTLLLGLLFISLRVFTRTVLTKNVFGWDDSLIIITWFIILSYCVAMWVSVSHGYGHRATSLSLEQLRQTIRAEIVAQACAIACFPTGKAAVAVLTAKIFPGRKLRWILVVIVLMNTFVFYIDSILIVVQCDPVWKQWTFDYEGGHCWDPSIVTNYGIFTGAIGCASDFILATIPWYYIPKLQMSMQQKIGIGFALSAGYFAGVCSILKVYYTTRLTSRADYAYDTIPLVLWSMAELCLINIAACIPTLAPLYQFIRRKGKWSEVEDSQPEYSLQNHKPDKKKPSTFVGYGYTGTAVASTIDPQTQHEDDDHRILVESTFSVEHDQVSRSESK